MAFKEDDPGMEITHVDWKNHVHQSSVLASLVQGVYVMERDRQKRCGQTRASRWWERFNFRLKEPLYDKDDSSIFGAIYEFKPPPLLQYQSDSPPPRFVIAFRGTILQRGSYCQDLKHNLLIILDRFRPISLSRLRTAMGAVNNMVANSAVGHSNIWLAGHSLGSAIAMHVGKNMARSGIFLKSFCFNPPYDSLRPLEILLGDENFKDLIRTARSFIKAALTVTVKSIFRSYSSEDSFRLLSPWVPYLFVNPADPICKGYLGYFEHRKHMEQIGAGSIGKIVTQNANMDLVWSIFGDKSERLHLIPSADVIVNMSRDPKQDFIQAHGLKQWWQADLHLQHRQYRHK